MILNEFIKKSTFKIPLRSHARLKGLLFQKICNDYIEQKYCNIFVIESYSFGDFVVFLDDEVHVYKFKAGKRPTFTPREKDEIWKLIRGEMNIKIFILTSDFALPDEYEIVEHEF